MPPSTLQPRRFFSAARPRERNSSRPCFKRITQIHDRIVAGHRVTAQTLSDELEISARTIKRDIEHLRDRHRAPLAWDAVRQTYYYTEAFDLCTGLRLDAAETLAVVLAGRTFAAWEGTPLGATLTGALGKIARFAGSAVSVPADAMRTCLFHPETTGGADAEHQHFARLLEDILARRELTLVYRKPKSPRPETRTVQPLHLAYLDHSWMLVAHDITRAAWRNFLLTRIENISATGKVFTPPPAAKIRRHLEGSLGRFTGDTELSVHLTFDATAAPYVRERPWHASQTITDRADGSIEVTLRLNNLIDVQRRLLACGSHVEVLAPEELRTALRSELQAMLAKHSP
jgi:predicted DNA-binding transcriptional regulator YafY